MLRQPTHSCSGLQCGLSEVLQSGSARQRTHTPADVSQNGVSEVQTELSRQCTHTPREVSHSGRSLDVQSAFVAQLSTHWRVGGSQVCPESQFAGPRHWTQECVERSQNGMSPLSQLDASTHSTQLCVAGSHTPLLQFLVDRHWTQRWLAASQ